MGPNSRRRPGPPWSDPANLVLVSAASIWEIEIKRALGRLDAGYADLVAEIEANRFVELADTVAGTPPAAAKLPRHHDDPFDRMLIAQSQLEGLVCVTPRSGLRGVRGSLPLVA